MQTLLPNPELALNAVHHLPTARTNPIPLPMVAPLPGETKAASASQVAQVAINRDQARANTYSELDAMLIRDPNVGAIHGLRAALLFNAGLALSGLLVWEVWSLLAA